MEIKLSQMLESDNAYVAGKKNALLHCYSLQYFYLWDLLKTEIIFIF